MNRVLSWQIGNVTRPTGSERFDTDKGEVTIKYFFSSKKQLLLKQGGA